MVRQFPYLGMANSIAGEMILRPLRFGNRKPVAYAGKDDVPAIGGTGGGGNTNFRETATSMNYRNARTRIFTRPDLREKRGKVLGVPRTFF
jgi:hypothetical protein